MVVTRGSYTEFQAVEVANAVNQGSVSDPNRYIWGLDYPSTARFIRVNADGRLETVAMGTTTVGDIGRVGTIGEIEHLGSIANTEFDIGRVGTIGEIESGTVNVSNMPSDYVKKENDYDFQTYDLNTVRASPGSALGLAGESLTVYTLSGSCSLRFDGTAKPAVPVEELTYPSMIVFDRQFTNAYLTNSVQSGKSLKLYIGKRT